MVSENEAIVSKSVMQTHPPSLSTKYKSSFQVSFPESQYQTNPVLTTHSHPILNTHPHPPLTNNQGPRKRVPRVPALPGKIWCQPEKSSSGQNIFV